MTIKARAKEILKRLKKSYQTRPEEFVHWSTPLELVVGTVLSAQCTDERVNKVTVKLFQKYRTAQDYANASLVELEKDIHSTGFYKSKVRYLKGLGQILVEKYDGNVPDSVEGLVELPGVAKKTAYLVMAKAYGKMEGVAVDTHVKRVAPRLGLTKQTNPDKISTDLQDVVEQEQWLNINEYLILHGRAICSPRKPKCGECPLNDICPSAFTFED